MKLGKMKNVHLTPWKCKCFYYVILTVELIFVFDSIKNTCRFKGLKIPKYGKSKIGKETIYENTYVWLSIFNKIEYFTLEQKLWWF